MQIIVASATKFTHYPQSIHCSHLPLVPVIAGLFVRSKRLGRVRGGGRGGKRALASKSPHIQNAIRMEKVQQAPNAHQTCTLNEKAQNDNTMDVERPLLTEKFTGTIINMIVGDNFAKTMRLHKILIVSWPEPDIRGDPAS